MLYVVKVVVESTAERVDYKIFRQRKDAEDRYYRAWALLDSGRAIGPLRDTITLSCALFVVDACDVREARRLTEAGQARLLKSDDNPFAEHPLDLSMLNDVPAIN
jgi:hypothetical protein